MKKILTKALSMLLAIICLISIVAFNTVSVSAASYSTDYSGYSTPSSSDYAYWNGRKVVKSTGTTKSEIKWMQAALNYCIKNKGINVPYLNVDGSFGPASKKATTAFQKKYGLSADGSFGPNTIGKMKSVLAEKKSNNYLTVRYNTHEISDFSVCAGGQGKALSFELPKFQVKSSSNWNVTSNVSWLIVNKERSGNTLRITCRNNNSYSERKGVVTLRGSDGVIKKFTITQMGRVRSESKGHVHNNKYTLMFLINDSADMVFVSVLRCQSCGKYFPETANPWSPPW